MATTTKKDFYEILGLSKSASADDIKKAYRSMARKHHPDVDKSDGAHEKFKEISEAYQVLSDPDKRKAYDQFGHAAFDRTGAGASGGSNPFGGGYRSYSYGAGGQGFNFNFSGFDDPFSVFEQFFGGGTRQRSRSNGQDLHYELTIDFRDAIFGTHKTISVAKDVTCDVCKGIGAEKGSKVETCPECQGSGQVQRVTQSFLGPIAMATVCPTCKGSGKKIEHSCHKCSGTGVVKGSVRQDINIPAGVDDSDTVRFQGLGDDGKNGLPAGDLYLIIRVLSDKNFRRRGDNIYSIEEVSPTVAVLGGILSVTTLTGTAELKIPSGTQPGTEFRLRNYGVPNRGDLYVTVNVKIPTKLSRQEKQLWEELNNSA